MPSVRSITGDELARRNSKLADAHRNSLQRASEVGAKTIAFPAISTGVYRYPVHEAAEISLRTVIGYLKEHPEIERVRFVLWDQATLLAFERALQEVTAGEPLAHGSARERKRPLIAYRARDVPDTFVHRRALVVAHDVAALEVLLHLGSLVGDVAVEEDAVARLRIERDVLGSIAPGAKLIDGVAVELGAVEAGRLAR